MSAAPLVCEVAAADTGEAFHWEAIIGTVLVLALYGVVSLVRASGCAQRPLRTAQRHLRLPSGAVVTLGQ